MAKWLIIAAIGLPVAVVTVLGFTEESCFERLEREHLVGDSRVGEVQNC